VDWLAAQTETFAEEKFVFDPAQRNIARVRQVLKAHKELMRSDLLRLTRLTAKQLDEALATLFQTEAVTERDVPGKGRTGKAYQLVS
jgi:predicted transcriptional regulator